MGTLIFVAGITVIIVWLARRGRVPNGPRSRLAGSTHIVDRDAERMVADLHARDLRT